MGFHAGFWNVREGGLVELSCRYYCRFQVGLVVDLNLPLGLRVAGDLVVCWLFSNGCNWKKEWGNGTMVVIWVEAPKEKILSYSI